MRKLSIFVLALAIAVPAAGQAGASTATQSVEVRVSDLDLDRSEDARVALRRFERAALRACGGGPGTLRVVRRLVAQSDCHREAVSQAVAAVASPTLNALYQAKEMRVASAR
jgi:UrcA family protein